MTSQLHKFNLQWLEENLGQPWTPADEMDCERVWHEGQEWLIHSYPTHAFLFIMRDYLIGMTTEIEGRLRELIPVLSVLGDSRFTVSALILLGILVMERRQQTDVVETVVEQVSPEVYPTTHFTEQARNSTMEQMLFRYLQGQIDVKEGKLQTAEGHYESILMELFGMYEPLNFLLGRMYQKIGMYILRTPGHVLEAKWRYRTNEWCARYPESPITKQLRWLAQSSIQGNEPIHPLHAWHMTRSSSLSHSLFLDTLSTGSLSVPEMDVVHAIVTARVRPSRESVERAQLMAEGYGDIFWILQAHQWLREDVGGRHDDGVGGQDGVRVEDDIGAGRNPDAFRLTAVSTATMGTLERGLRFTYFRTFQGYTLSDDVLFPPTYSRHKVKQLLGIMLLQPRFRIVRDRLLLLLFGEDHGDSEGNYLHVTLHRLRQQLRKQTGLGADWVSVREGMVALNEHLIDHVDIEEYRKVAALGHELWQSDREAALKTYAQAVNMYHPIVAPEFEYEDWIAETRTLLDQQQRRILKRLWRAERETGRTDGAVHRGEQLLALDPFDLSVLEELCGDWVKAGDIKTMQQTCARTRELLLSEGEVVPEWLAHIVE